MGLDRKDPTSWRRGSRSLRAEAPNGGVLDLKLTRHRVLLRPLVLLPRCSSDDKVASHDGWMHIAAVEVVAGLRRRAELDGLHVPWSTLDGCRGDRELRSVAESNRDQQRITGNRH